MGYLVHTKEQFFIFDIWLFQQSLDDVGAELTQMRTELQKLMEVIQTKDQAIEDLEAQLKVSKDKVTAK